MEQNSKVYQISDEEFIKICENSASISQINHELGYSSIGTHTYLLIRKRISELNRPDLEQKFPQKGKRSTTNRIRSLSKEELSKIAESSFSYSECLDKIGIERNKNKSFSQHIYNVLKECLEKNSIDFSHFSQLIGIHKHVEDTKVNINTYFVKNSTHGTTPMKRIILRENLLPYECQCCGNKGNWNGKPLILELHHFDGDRTNNELTNLGFLCPNCHSQTLNFSGKNTEK